MWTETYAQIMDRAIIERLKERMFAKDNRLVLSDVAGKQAKCLEIAAETYLFDVQDGKLAHTPHKHLRFHDHGNDKPLPASVDDCLAELRLVHEKYWETQTEIQHLKEVMRESTTIDESFELAAEAMEFYELQLVIDRCNQRRNEVRSECDFLLNEELLKEDL